MRISIIMQKRAKMVENEVEVNLLSLIGRIGLILHILIDSFHTLFGPLILQYHLLYVLINSSIAQLSIVGGPHVVVTS